MALLEEPETIRGHVADAAGSMAAKTAVVQATAVQTAIDGTAGALAGLSTAVFGPLSVSLAATASVLINQTHYQSKRAALRVMYKDEVAAQLGKSPDRIKDEDIDLIAKGDAKRGIAANKTIAEELQTLKKRRNVGMLVTALTILSTVAIVASLPGIAGVAAGGVGLFAARMIAGFAIHKLLENPIKKTGKKIFKLDTPTTHDRIADLSKQHRKGKTISREQVMDVFVSANKELSQFVIDNYGMHYDKLSVQDKHVVVEAMEQHMPITSMTKNLNSGTVKISELAFAVEGKISGVEPNTVKDNLSLVGKARHALMGVGTRLHNVAQRHNTVAANSVLQKNAAIKHQVAMEYNNPTPSRSFVERYQNEKTTGISHTIH
ncbi:MAG: hypothetical protein AABY33_05940 [Pseudomonadota bacterium]